MSSPSDSNKVIYIACPWSPVGGGMFKVADYMIQSQTPDLVPPAERARLVPLDTRGGGAASMSAVVLTMALARMFASKLTGKLAGVHVNMAERLSMYRKCVVVLTARALGVPVVLHLHAAQLHHTFKTLPGLVQAFVRKTFASATRVVVLGRASQDFVTNTLRVPADRVEIINNGVPASTVERKPLSASGERRRIFFLGNLSERKGVTDLLQALSRSQMAQAGRVDAVFAGGGDVDAYTAKAKALGVDGFTRFVGWANQQQAAEWMASSDALALPSYDEGLPLVILEALGHGVAVICTPVGEIPHNLHDGQDAHFVEPGRVDQLAAAIDRVLGDDAYRQKLEAGGKALFNSGFSLDHYADSIARVHLQCFGAAARPVKKGALA